MSARSGLQRRFFGQCLRFYSFQALECCCKQLQVFVQLRLPIPFGFGSEGQPRPGRCQARPEREAARVWGSRWARKARGRGGTGLGAGLPGRPAGLHLAGPAGLGQPCRQGQPVRPAGTGLAATIRGRRFCRRFFIFARRFCRRFPADFLRGNSFTKKIGGKSVGKSAALR